MSIEQHDERVIWRCPLLGGEVTFLYCRKLLDGLPCPRLAACWRNLLDVEAFLESHYDLDQLAAAWSRPSGDKMTQLADLIDKARKPPS